MPKVVTHYICPPIPFRDFDWVAYFDGQEESGICGHGKTEIDALDDLYTLTFDKAEERAILDARSMAYERDRLERAMDAAEHARSDR